jgi:hypothetical protein
MRLATSVERLSSLGYVPRVSGSLKINCPVTSEQIRKFESTVKSKEQSPMDALTGVFCGKSDQGAVLCELFEEGIGILDDLKCFLFD